jgi:hypothetical protein
MITLRTARKRSVFPSSTKCARFIAPGFDQNFGYAVKSSVKHDCKWKTHPEPDPLVIRPSAEIDDKARKEDTNDEDH